MITGSLQIKNGTYYAVLNLRNADGERRQKWVNLKLPEKNNKKRAETKLAELKAEYDRLDPTFDNGIAFWQFFDEWLQLKEGKVAETTFQNYQTMAKCHIIPYFKGRKLSLGAILPIHIEQFYHALLTEKRLSPNSVIHIHELIFGVFKYAKKNHMIAENPAEYVDRPKKQKYVADHYNLDELNKLLRVAKRTEIEVPVYLAAYFGLRRSEALGVRWSAIDFEKRTLSIQHSVVRTRDKETGVLGAHGRDQLKTESSFRTLPLSDEMIEYLKDLKLRQAKQQLLCGKDYCREYLDYLCVNKIGNIIQPDYVTARFGKLLKQNGLRHIRFHDLRHSCATLLLHLGFSMKEIQQWLGHSTFQLTADTYSHVTAEDKTAMAEGLNGAINL